MLILKGDLVLNLRKFTPDPGVIDVSIGVKIGQCLKGLICSIVIQQPPRTFREEHDEQSKETSWKQLDSEADAPLLAAGIRIAGESSCPISGFQMPLDSFDDIPKETELAISAPIPSINCCSVVTIPRIFG